MDGLAMIIAILMILSGVGITLGTPTQKETRKVYSKLHDYTIRAYGHDFFITKILSSGQILEAGGWGTGLKKGDYLLLPNKNTESKTTRYRITVIEYQGDPQDMWFATLAFAPRTQKLE